MKPFLLRLEQLEDRTTPSVCGWDMPMIESGRQECQAACAQAASVDPSDVAEEEASRAEACARDRRICCDETTEQEQDIRRGDVLAAAEALARDARGRVTDGDMHGIYVDEPRTLVADGHAQTREDHDRRHPAPAAGGLPYYYGEGLREAALPSVRALSADIAIAAIQEAIQRRHVPLHVPVEPLTQPPRATPSAVPSQEAPAPRLHLEHSAPVSVTEEDLVPLELAPVEPAAAKEKTGLWTKIGAVGAGIGVGALAAGWRRWRGRRPA